MIEKRLNHEPPAVIATLGWRYHHIGIPYTQPRAQEHHVAHLGVHVSGFETSPYGLSCCSSPRPGRSGQRQAAEQRAARHDARAKEMCRHS
jgi:hypothetical protein